MRIENADPRPAGKKAAQSDMELPRTAPTTAPAAPEDHFLGTRYLSNSNPSTANSNSKPLSIIPAKTWVGIKKSNMLGTRDNQTPCKRKISLRVRVYLES